MTDFIVRHFIKDYENIKDRKVRSDYGAVAGMVGISVNLLLFAVKFMIGFISGAVSVMADAFNNLSDVASSLISVVGAKLAGKPADEEHPFGHGRIEYLAALLVAFLVLQVGFMLLKSSAEKLLHPEALSFSYLSVLVLVISILGKFWLSLFNMKLGKRIGSQVMLATAADARSDMLATAATILSLIIYHLFAFNIDGLIGIVVSVFILKCGIEIIKDTLEPIIGAGADTELCELVTSFVESYEGVIGTHDLIVHNYGPSHDFASIHVEVDNRMSLDEAHVLLDGIEQDALKKYKLMLVTHADPVELHDAHTNEVREIVRSVVAAEQDEKLSFHDVRLIKASGEKTNVVFDLVLPWNYTEEHTKELVKRIRQAITQKDKSLAVIITIEHSFGL